MDLVSISGVQQQMALVGHKVAQQVEQNQAKTVLQVLEGARQAAANPPPADGRGAAVDISV